MVLSEESEFQACIDSGSELFLVTRAIFNTLEKSL